MKKMLFLVNPCAGQKKARRYLTDMIELFNRSGYAVMTHITACPGDGEKAIAAHAGEAELVVCCGGDGTFNETVSGVVKSGMDVPIGYIPAGSTNDFAASLGLSTNILQATRDVLEGSPRSIDIGCFAGRYFSYVASFGAFTRASYLTPQNVKNILGHAAYVLGGIQELSQLRPYAMRFDLPDGTVLEGEYLFGAISNTTSVGGVLTLDKNKVDLSDGKLELLLIHTPKDLKELADCVLALQKQDYSSPMLSFRSICSLTVHAPQDMEWTLDGERELPHEQAQIQCLNKAVRVICKP